MNLIITMGGLGLRFRQAGYKEPKYMIEVKGKSLFEWSLDSLLGYHKYVSKYVFVVRKEDHAKHFIQEKCKRYNLFCVEILELEYLTDGQATTALLGLETCHLNESMLIYNIDTYVEPYAMKMEDINAKGHIPCFRAPGDHWSFVRTDSQGKALEVKEKVRISDCCTLGAYYFSSGKLYQEIYHEYYGDNSRMKTSERYVAPLYNLMIEKGMDVTVSMVNSDKVHVLGTPQELEAFMAVQ